MRVIDNTGNKLFTGDDVPVVDTIWIECPKCPEEGRRRFIVYRGQLGANAGIELKCGQCGKMVRFGSGNEHDSRTASN